MRTISGQVILEGNLRLPGKRSAIAPGQAAQLVHHLIGQAKADGFVPVTIWVSTDSSHAAHCTIAYNVGPTEKAKKK